MLNSISQLTGSHIVATDGEIGHVLEAYFDDQAWAIRYLVVDTGSWLAGREVLISPYAVRQPVGSGKTLDVALTRAQVAASPGVDTHRPVSRQHERDDLHDDAHLQYRTGGELWAFNALPLLPSLPLPLPTAVETMAQCAARDAEVPAGDMHLRSSHVVTGYDIAAADGSIGHVKDFLYDDDSWAIRYLVIDTRNWWPGGKKVLVAVHWIDSIDWAGQTLRVALRRDQLRNCPAYDEAATVDRAHEQHLHDACGRAGYWI